MNVKVTQTWTNKEYEVLYDDIRGEYEAYHLKTDEDVVTYTADPGWGLSDFVQWYMWTLDGFLDPNAELTEHVESDDRETYVFQNHEDGSAYSLTFEIA